MDDCSEPYRQGFRGYVLASAALRMKPGNNKLLSLSQEERRMAEAADRSRGGSSDAALSDFTLCPSGGAVAPGEVAVGHVMAVLSLAAEP